MIENPKLETPNQEDFTQFTPTSTNTAGDQRLEVGTKIISMIPTKDETFIQTDEAAYGMAFVGPPFTFSFRLLAVNCGGVALHGAANVIRKYLIINKGACWKKFSALRRESILKMCLSDTERKNGSTRFKRRNNMTRVSITIF